MTERVWVLPERVRASLRSALLSAEFAQEERCAAFGCLCDVQGSSCWNRYREALHELDTLCLVADVQTELAHERRMADVGWQRVYELRAHLAAVTQENAAMRAGARIGADRMASLTFVDGNGYRPNAASHVTPEEFKEEAVERFIALATGGDRA